METTAVNNPKGTTTEFCGRIETEALDGLKFFVYEGAYKLDPVGMDAELAKSEGWFEAAKDVSSAADIRNFIHSNGGTVVNAHGLDVYAVAASADDMKVRTAILGYDKMKEKAEKKKTTNSSSSSNARIVDNGFSRHHSWYSFSR